jgi:hypothetical protein
LKEYATSKIPAKECQEQGWYSSWEDSPEAVNDKNCPLKADLFVPP